LTAEQTQRGLKESTTERVFHKCRVNDWVKYFQITNYFLCHPSHTPNTSTSYSSECRLKASQPRSKYFLHF
jgi:hypothetical protein